jgi:hypothetical protein
MTVELDENGKFTHLNGEAVSPGDVWIIKFGDSWFEFKPTTEKISTNPSRKEKLMDNPIMKYFEYQHLPEHLQAISKPFCETALWMSKDIPDGPEKSAGLRKLLEAKDCAVRAAL